MTTLKLEVDIPDATSVAITDDTLTVELSDGRSISLPLSWYPRLLQGSEKERENWRLIGAGQGIHWTDLDEDISVESIIAGRPSRESQASYQRWLNSRASA